MWIILGMLLAVVIVLLKPTFPWLAIAAVFYLITNLFSAITAEVRKRMAPRPPGQ